ncbi:hypothetical protein ACFFWC_30440 [Plantactinospora siamensis]|uniref:Sensor domain-containing protein n=1 Tax=Plantactinospora siamensis TaxID=555372 RepID=A0ABV6P661_9ACTN
MPTVHPQPTTVAARRPGPAYRIVQATGDGVRYIAALLPVAVAAAVAIPLGQGDAATGWSRRLAGRRTDPAVRPGWPRLAAYGLLSLLLAAVAVIPLGCLALFVARGMLYGIVDHGPYDTSWGGPSRGGAWLAHFLVGIPIALAALAGAAGLAALHRRLTGWLDGRPTR